MCFFENILYDRWRKYLVPFQCAKQRSTRPFHGFRNWSLICWKVKNIFWLASVQNWGKGGWGWFFINQVPINSYSCRVIWFTKISCPTKSQLWEMEKKKNRGYGWYIITSFFKEKNKIIENLISYSTKNGSPSSLECTFWSRSDEPVFCRPVFIVFRVVFPLVGDVVGLIFLELFVLHFLTSLSISDVLYYWKSKKKKSRRSSSLPLRR